MKVKFYIFFILLSFGFIAKAQKYTSKQIDSLEQQVLKIVDYKKALKLSFECYSSSKEIGYKKGKIDALHNIIMVYYNVGFMDKVISFSDKLQKMAYAEENYYEVAFTMHRKAFAFKATLLQKEADQSINEAVKIAKDKLKGDDYNLIMGDVYKYKGAVEMNKSNNEKALLYHKKSYAYYSKIKNQLTRKRAIIKEQYSVSYSYLNLKRYDSADFHTKTMIIDARNSNDSVALNDGFHLLAQSYFLRKKDDSAIYYYKKVLPAFIKMNSLSRLMYAYKDLATIYQRAGDIKNFNFYHGKSREAITTEEDANDVLYESILNEVVDDENEKWYSVFYPYIGIIVLLIIGIIFFIFSLLKKLHQGKIQKEKFQVTLIEKEEQLSHIESKINDAFEEVMILAKKDDPAFLSRFKEVYPEFYDKITTSYPELTLNQLRFCAMMKLNFSTKEIADYHHMSVRGVQIKKNRLRKQLEIPSDIDLNKWMMEL